MKPLTCILLLLLLVACKKSEPGTTLISSPLVDAIDSGNYIIIDSVKHYHHIVNGSLDCKSETFDHGLLTVVTIVWTNTEDSTFYGVQFRDRGIDRGMMLSLNRDGKYESYVCQDPKFTHTSSLFYPFVYSGVKMYYTNSHDIAQPPSDSSRFVVVSGMTSCR